MTDLLAWLTAGGLCLAAAVACLLIPKRPVPDAVVHPLPVTDSR